MARHGAARRGRGCATVMAIVQNREWEIVTLSLGSSGDFVARPLILREARPLNRYSRHGAMKLIRCATLFFLAFMQRVLIRAVTKVPLALLARGIVASVVSISERKDRAVMRGNCSRYNEGRSTLCIIVALQHEEKVYPVPFECRPATKAKAKKGRVLEGPR
jgi:hypothetical protein